MEIKHIFSVCLLAALGVAAAYGQVANTEEDEEPIDLELVRKPVRRPGHPVITYIKVLVGDEKAKRYVEVKTQPKEKSESNFWLRLVPKRRNTKRMCPNLPLAECTMKKR